jgi:phenylacetate-coenzyme A ligase PaaK-like adenylate-forming protein
MHLQNLDQSPYTTSFNFHEMHYYPIEHVLAVATIHPFYQPTIQFPPDSDQIHEVVSSSSTGLSSPTARSLTSVPLTHKKDLYQTIQRLGSDRDPRNNYRRGSYISVTGGGSGGIPMMFATDGRENRNQRSTAGRLIQACGVIEANDWVLTMHSSGALYRSLDLVTEMLENAGASVLCAGHLMSHANVVKLCVAHCVNVVCGDSSQILQFALHVAGLPPATRDALCINKVIYTSEPLVRAQRRYLTSVLGPVSICSLFASAESGPWAVMNLALTGDVADDAADFIFDSRAMCVEVLPLSALNEDQPQSASAREIHALPDGEKGAIILTSLQRLRNPLVRYVTGDVGSLHPLPAAAIASISNEIAPHLRVLRLQGRDQRFSFKWQGEYFELHFLEDFFQQREDLGVLQWQILLRDNEHSHAQECEVRLLRGRRVVEASPPAFSDSDLVQLLEKVFCVRPLDQSLFGVTFVVDGTGFERSATGNKVLRFVNRSTVSQ